jgi:cation:H+ antiporter
MFWTVILFILGLYILVKGADATVKGATSLARFFNVSSWVIGVLIVGIGTSIPELSINISSVIKGEEVGVGTILGSNIFNILFILGLTSIAFPISLKKNWVYRDVILNMFAICIAGFFAFFHFFGEPFSGITRPEGFIIFLLFILWVWYILTTPDVCIGQNCHEPENNFDTEGVTLIVAIFLIIFGLIGVFLGGNWVVDGAHQIANILKVPESIISILILGIGTSMPELMISISALRNKMGGIAIGNIIGSNIFDFIGILGISSIFGNIAISRDILFDFFVAFFATVMLFVSMMFGQKFTLERKEGVLFIIIYFGYIAYLLRRLIFGW